MWQVVEKTIEKDKEAYMTFVDLEKVYDNVSREKLWMVLEGIGWKESCLGQSRHYMTEAWYV